MGQREAQGLQILVYCLHVSHSVTPLPHPHLSLGFNGMRRRVQEQEAVGNWLGSTLKGRDVGWVQRGAEMADTHWAYVCPCKSCA